MFLAPSTVPAHCGCSKVFIDSIDFNLAALQVTGASQIETEAHFILYLEQASATEYAHWPIKV